MSKNLNYNTDIVKHYVRYNGWKDSFRIIKNYVDREVYNQRRLDKCKYLTFCAVQAIDVFMLEMDKHIYRDKETKRLTNVFFCENDEEAFSIINKMIGSDGQGFFGDFKDIVLQDLNEKLQISNDPFDEPASPQEREKLRLKDVKKNLIKFFPFDVINLDFYGNFFPKSQQRFSDSCQTFNEVLNLQKSQNGYSCNRFLMFLTVYTPIIENQINNEALQQLSITLFQNMGYERFKKAFMEKFNLHSPNELDLYLQFILGFTKQIVFRESYRIGWQPKLKDIYCYDRKKEVGGEMYKISTFIVEFHRNAELERLDFAGAVPNEVESDYLTQLEGIILNQPHNVPKEKNIPSAIKEDLEKIVLFRNNFLKEIGIYDEAKFE